MQLNPKKWNQRREKYYHTADLKKLSEGKRVLKYEIIECLFCKNSFKPKTGLQKHCSDFCKRKRNDRILKPKRISKNREHVRNVYREWYKSNENILEKKNKYSKQRRDSNIQVKIASNIRSRFKEALKRERISKKCSVLDITGCSLKQLKKHLEQQFTSGMSWDNYGFYGWHIDHIIPVSRFDLTKIEEQKKCFHYTNLQPLWGKENMSKGNRI